LSEAPRRVFPERKLCASCRITRVPLENTPFAGWLQNGFSFEQTPFVFNQSTMEASAFLGSNLLTKSLVGNSMIV
jgi:hypothetical protein